jgi:cation:H+ antiporter
LSVPLALLLFIGSLAVTLGAARMFAGRLDRIGTRLRFPEPLIGFLTALAADGPEISSALFALIRGSHSVGVGVLVGSNTFNIAAMIGVSALIAASVRPARSTLLLEGCVGVAITLIAVAVLRGWLAPVLAALIAGAILIPYLARLIRGTHPAASASAESEPRDPEAEQDASEDPTHHLIGLVVLDVVLIIAGSVGMVQAAIDLGHSWHISDPVLGVVALGPLTSLPNAMTGIRLGLAGRGEALVGEAFNSNTINLAAGVILPGLFVTLIAGTSTARLELWWLIGMTVAMIALLARPRGLGRVGGACLIALYAGFLAVALT